MRSEGAFLVDIVIVTGELYLKHIPVTKFYVSWTNIDRNLGTPLKDAKIFQDF
jgi:hypothetical protein